MRLSDHPKVLGPDALGVWPTLPVFTEEFGKETMGNSSPYLMSLEAFCRRYAGNPLRQRLINLLRADLRDAARSGVIVNSLLVGGSFLNLSNPAPNDIDTLAIYSLRSDAHTDAAMRWLIGRDRQSASHLQLCPADAGLTILVKRVLFFQSLFAYEKSTGALTRGTILIDLAEVQTS